MMLALFVASTCVGTWLRTYSAELAAQLTPLQSVAQQNRASTRKGHKNFIAIVCPPTDLGQTDRAPMGRC
jgi:hypothetical protein